MTQMMQSGSHPDAETLTAFAEQLLSDAEREPVLAHMAQCGRCREVVFLSQRAVAADEPVSSEAVQPPQNKPSRSWLAAWRWSWVPIAALAGVVGFAVLRHSRHAELPDVQMAQKASPRENLKREMGAKAPAASPGQSTQSSSENKPELATNRRSERDEESTAPRLDHKDHAAAQKKDDSAQNANHAKAFSPSNSVVDAREAVAAGAKPPDLEGSFAQTQIRPENKSELRRSAEVGKAEVSSGPPTKPAPAAMQVGSASESVSVQSDREPPSASMAPSTAPQLAADSLQMALSNKALAKSARSALPSGLEVLSEASSEKKRIALDSAGSVFFSGDGGKHWHAVKPFWTGRAISVKSGTSANGIDESALASAPAEFELSTSEGQKWISVDGQSWKLEPQTDR